MSKKLKKPSDYQQFSFRVNEIDKNHLMLRLDNILITLRDNKKDDEYAPRQNTLILDALDRGLTQIEEELFKK
jgi:hypothetical protein